MLGYLRQLNFKIPVLLELFAEDHPNTTLLVVLLKNLRKGVFGDAPQPEVDFLHSLVAARFAKFSVKSSLQV